MTIKINKLPVSLACALVATFSTFTITAQRVATTTQGAKRPALVVGIIIDGLDLDKIEQLRDYFGNNGFNRLIEQGVTITDLDYGSTLDETAATSVIYTGASPAVSGIASTTVYSPTLRRETSVFNSPQTIGNFTDETYSPEAIRVSTLADEVRISGGGLNGVHAISPDAEQAIVMAGHAGSSAAWINDRTAKWASTTYYTDLPTTIRNVNHIRPLSTRLDTLSWAPTMPKGVYDYLPPYKKIYSFRHTFPRGDYNRVVNYKRSAPVNDEVTSVATDYIRSMNLGKGEVTDMVNLNYTLQPYPASIDGDASAELLDSYIRLDREIDRLFKAIDAAGPGMDRTLVFVAGTPVTTSSRRDEERYRIPSGEFSPTRALSLLKVNLMSIFGNGDWVTGYHNGQFFLNHDLIRERGKNLDDIRRESADFLRRMSGVTHAVTIDEILAGTNFADNSFPPARNIDIATAGDVFIAVAPGWSISDNGDNSNVTRAASTLSTAFILYPSVKAQTITERVDARSIAPTISRILRIRSPNGAQTEPLRL